MATGWITDGAGKTSPWSARSLLPAGKSFLAAGAAAMFLLLAAPAPAQQVPLPADLQERVNKAIDDGVTFLKAAQNPFGTWTLNQAQHPLGYAALGGLTLLVCDVPAGDPAVQRAAKFVRMGSVNANKTYELALSILFLDKLGDK